MKLARSDKVLALIVVIALIGIVVALVAALATQTSSEDIRNTTSKEDITNTTSTSAPPPPPATTTSSAPPSSTITSTSPATTTSPRKDRYDSVYKQYRYAAVTTDTNICSQIGAEILETLNGSAVDAAIASMFCVGVVNAHSTGIGGGHFATIYDTPRGGSEKVLLTLMSRERAPGNAYRDMFVNRTQMALKGGLAIAVPGEVSGHYVAWQKFGRLPWADLVTPTAVLCEKGFTVEKSLASAIRQYEETIRNDSNFAELFVKKDGSLIQEGDLLRNPKLAKTFRRIAADPTTYYNGSLAREIVDDITDYGGNVTVADLEGYDSSFKDPVSVTLKNGNYTIYNPPPPSSGVVLDFILAVLDGYKFSSLDVSDVASQVRTYHRIVEAFKFAYAKRSSLGDEDFVNVTELVANLTSPEYAAMIRDRIDDSTTHDIPYYNPTLDFVPDHGTTHLNVLAKDGSAVAMTSTINFSFGASARGKRTGIIFNDEMDDTSTPGTINGYGVVSSPSNYIVPGKMPMSSMSPSIVFDSSQRVAYVSGASGGTRITTETAFVLMNNLWFDKDPKNATDTPRIHHQLTPNEIFVEKAMLQPVLDGLLAKNHTISNDMSALAVVESIRSRCHLTSSFASDDNCIEAVSDGRKGGTPAGF